MSNSINKSKIIAEYAANKEAWDKVDPNGSGDWSDDELQALADYYDNTAPSTNPQEEQHIDIKDVMDFLKATGYTEE